jgi:hypothetical protein
MQKKLQTKNRRGVTLFQVRLRLRVLKTSSNQAVFLCKRNCRRKIVEESNFFRFNSGSMYLKRLLTEAVFPYKRNCRRKIVEESHFFRFDSGSGYLKPLQMKPFFYAKKIADEKSSRSHTFSGSTPAPGT